MSNISAHLSSASHTQLVPQQQPSRSPLPLAGMEVAAALTDKAHSVSVIGIESVPFKQALGEKVGKAIMKVDTGNSFTLLSVGAPRAFSSPFCLFAAF